MGLVEPGGAGIVEIGQRPSLRGCEAPSSCWKRVFRVMGGSAGAVCVGVLGGSGAGSDVIGRARAFQSRGREPR